LHSLKRVSGTLEDKLTARSQGTYPYRNTKHYNIREISFLRECFCLSRYVLVSYAPSSYKIRNCIFFHHMCTLINPLGKGLRCSLDSSLEILCLNPHRRRMGLSSRQIPKGRMKVKSVVWHLMNCGYTTYISLSRAYTITYFGTI